MLVTVLPVNKGYPLLVLGVFFAGSLIWPRFAAAITQPFAHLTVPARVMVNGTDSPVPAGSVADSIKVRWNWNIQAQGHRGGRFQDEEVLTEHVIKYDNPRRLLEVGDSIGTPSTRLFDQEGQPCIVEIEWTLVENGTTTVGFERSQDFLRESPYPGYGNCP